MKPIPRPGDPRYEYLMAKHGLAPRSKTYTTKRAQAQFERLLADVAAGCVVEITRRGKIVASVVAPAALETLEIMASPEAMRADKAGRLIPLSSEGAARHLAKGPAVGPEPTWPEACQPHPGKRIPRRKHA